MTEDAFYEQLDKLATILNPAQDPAPATGTCPVCNRPYRLTKTGRVWTHGTPTRDTGSGSYGLNCRGAGQPPKEQQ